MATLSVNISETITINGQERNASNTIDITGITQLNQRIVNVDSASENSLVLFDTAEAAGQFADGSTDYIRITNLDSTNFVTLRMTHASDEYFVKISAGDSFVLFESVMDADSTAGASTATLANLDSIKAQANSADCLVELFIAA
jgi:hypothetical protein